TEEAAAGEGGAGAAEAESGGKAAGENTAPSAESTDEAADTGAGSGSSAAGGSSGAAEAAEARQVSSPNFKVYDSVSGAFLASLAVDISDGDTVAEVTMSALDGDCRATGSGDSIYFSRIMGLSEKSAGPMSGWCFYVNGQKPGLSAGAYKLKAGDVVEWKFLKDGTNN
ncbi:MAG: hypothetical protein H6Q58_1219, partial [Firmicutes bacterium]|nr:hypothetical protein [Bacillota bacterium]